MITRAHALRYRAVLVRLGRVVREDIRPRPFALRVARRSLDGFLATRHPDIATAAGASPPLPSFGPLRDAGVPLGAAAGASAAEDVGDARRVLSGYGRGSRFAGSDVEKISARVPTNTPIVKLVRELHAIMLCKRLSRPHPDPPRCGRTVSRGAPPRIALLRRLRALTRLFAISRHIRRHRTVKHFYRHLYVLVLICVLAACAEPEPVTEEVDLDEAPTVTESAWTYEGTTGPEAWGTLSDEYAVCGVGQEQSPVALRTESAEQADLPALQFQYGAADFEVAEAGFGYIVTPTEATPDEMRTLQIGDDTYRLLQFHTHAPGEHTIDGQLYPLTLHFVHQNEAGELAVVGVMVEEGAEGAAFTPLLEAVGAGPDVLRMESIEALLPSDRTYFTYDGSLTTPPCTEGVRWIVMQEPITLSAAQIAAFAEPFGETNRPLQPLGDRTIRISE